MDPLLDLFDGSGGTEKRSSLPPEIEEGNVEYKLKLLNPSTSRFEHLVTQMKWRLQEGRGEAIYEIGVADSGYFKGLTETEMGMSLETVKRMASRLGASMNILRKQQVPFDLVEKRWVAEVLVRKVPDNQQFLDIRLAVLGNMGVGKSTLLGVLTQGEMDNGRGKVRLNLFRHLHEIQSGRTSSISHEIMGLTADGETVNYSTHATAEEICEASAKLITFIDLAGHQKYLKTTVFGLTAHRPDIAMLVVGANSGVGKLKAWIHDAVLSRDIGTACEHLGFCMALKLPTFVVVSKVDLCTEEQLKIVEQQLRSILSSPGCNKIPVLVKTEGEVYNAAQKFTTTNICPIFLVSSVTGQNLDLLVKFLNTVPKQHPVGQLEQQTAEFHVDETYLVPDVGVVAGGILTRGIVRVGDEMMIGPNEDNNLVKTAVMSIHRYRSPCRVIKAGQAATLALNNVDRSSVRKGTVLLDMNFQLDNDMAGICRKFKAEVFLLNHTGSGVRKGFKATLYTSSSMQTASIEDIDGKESLETGQRAKVTFQFVKHSEFIRKGLKIIFHEGRTRGMGEITDLIPHSPTLPNR